MVFLVPEFGLNSIEKANSKVAAKRLTLIGCCDAYGPCCLERKRPERGWMRRAHPVKAIRREVCMAPYHQCNAHSLPTQFTLLLIVT